MKVIDTASAAQKSPRAATVETSNTSSEPAKPENMFNDLEEPTTPSINETTEAEFEDAQLPGTSPKEEQPKLIKEKYSENDLIITPEEKNTFIDAIITGDRYRQRFSLFGGKVSVVIRSRTTDETQAFYAYIRYRVLQDVKHTSSLETDAPYVPLVAQIEEINGVKYPEMKTPLFFKEEAGVLQEPGWYEDFKMWKNKPSSLTSALISCIQLFEYKYWTMTREAGNKNFWNSDTSSAD